MLFENRVGKSTQSLIPAVVGVTTEQGMEVPAVRMFAALDARNVVVYWGDESVVRFNIFLSPYTTHGSPTLLPPGHVACCVAACMTHAGTLRRALVPARVFTTERPSFMSTSRGSPMRGTPDGVLLVRAATASAGPPSRGARGYGMGAAEGRITWDG